MGYFSSLLVLTELRDLILLSAAAMGESGAGTLRASAFGMPLLALAVTLVGPVNAC